MLRRKTRGSKAVRAGKRKYNRQFTDVCASASMRGRLRLLTMSEGVDWTPKLWMVGQRPLPGVVHRSETRWITRQKFIQTSVPIPYIDRVGKYSGSITAVSNLPPAGLISTVISTVYRRIYNVLRRKVVDKRYFELKKWRTLLLRCSAYYTLTKNNYYWDRLLAMIRSGTCRRVISAHLHHHSRRLDDHKWFVFGQACLQANWLTSRGVTRPRDKLSLKTDLFRFRPHVGSEHEPIEQFVYTAIWRCCCSITSLSA